MALSASYLGIDIPSLPSGAPYCALSDGGSVPRISPPGERRRHIPRPIAALVAVYDRGQRGATRHLDNWDRLLVDVRHSAATRRRYRGTPCTIHDVTG